MREAAGKMLDALNLPSGKQKLFDWFHKALGVIYLTAALPLYFQIEVLIGNNGLSPASELINASVNGQGKIFSFLQFPSLFHFYPHTITLYALIAFTCIGGLMLISGFKIFYGAILAWLSFLSLCTVGGDFFTIIIDFFLLETGFLAIFSAYYAHKKYLIPNLVAWAFVLLNFRLWFCMGINKFYMPQNVWTDLTFFNYFFHAQPMPTPLAPVFSKTPMVLKQLAVIALFAAEIIIPFFVFAGRKLRWTAFITFFIVSALIQLTGNYGYFNVLSVVVALLILKDDDLPQLFRTKNKSIESIGNSKNSWLKYILLFQMLQQFLYCLWVFNPSPPSPQNHFNQIFANVNSTNSTIKALIYPFKLPEYWRICNPYGVFKGIPSYHSEIRLSGSTDSIHWQTYSFRYLPSAFTNYLGFYAPYYPRLDHLLFYESIAAQNYKWNPLNEFNNDKNAWIYRFIDKLLINDPGLSTLLKNNPFDGKNAPAFIKAEVFRLSFNQKNGWKDSSMNIVKIYSIKEPCRKPLINFEEAMKTAYVNY